MSKKELINKVAKKAIIQLDIEKLIPKATDIVAFDVKDFLFKEMLLKENDFRTKLSEYDFSNCTDKYVYLYCSNKAIIPLWAYMLLTSYIEPFSKVVAFSSSLKEAQEQFLLFEIKNLNLTEYTNQRVIIKGCSNNKISPSVYVSLVAKLQSVVKSIMFGEACSMLPIYKKSK